MSPEPWMPCRLHRMVKMTEWFESVKGGQTVADLITWVQQNETLLWILAVSSVIIFVGTLLAAPWLMARIPADYFTRRGQRRIRGLDLPPLLYGVLMVLKNVLGFIFVIAGILMLVLPGQGILTILAGIILLNFPGKYRLECWIVKHKPVYRTINWFRRRRGKKPLILKEILPKNQTSRSDPNPK